MRPRNWAPSRSSHFRQVVTTFEALAVAGASSFLPINHRAEPPSARREAIGAGVNAGGRSARGPWRPGSAWAAVVIGPITRVTTAVNLPLVEAGSMEEGAEQI